jgi:hypothetical protein
MIKRIQFAAKHDAVAGDGFAAAWHDALATAMTAGAGVRPVRSTSCATLPEVEGNDPRHDVIAFQWFDDAAHLARFEAWLATDAGAAHERRLDELAKSGSRALVVADEHVMRGADWLEERWRDGGPKFKHMAVAMRAAGLTQAEFSELWVSRAGQVRTSGASAATVIPDAARGLAYVQNHPAPRADGDWPYDAVNEVYFDDLDALRVRVEFFAQTLGDQTEDDLVGDNWFVIAREEVVAG